MTVRQRLANAADMLVKMSRYNLKIIFANKFIFFLIAAVAFYLLVTLIDFFSSDPDTSEGSVFYMLLFPGLLLVFYPTAFGIQSDVDVQMIEILFGIPNYRYKVWLVRMALIYVLVFVMMVLLCSLSSLAIAPVPIFRMVFHLMFPIFFLGSLAFMVSTVVRSGNGTAVIMVIVGLAFWISAGVLEYSKWNIFLNPFSIPSEGNEAIWGGVILHNRLYLLAGIVLSILLGLYNMQKREKFI